MKSARSLESFIVLPRLIGLGLMLLISALPPAAVLTLGWQGLQQTLQAEIDAQSTIATRTIGRNPGIWMLTLERLAFPLRDLHQPERQLILADNRGEILVHLGEMPAWPTLVLTRPVFEYGEPVGRIELTGSLRPVLAKTAGTGLLTLLLGLAVVVPLYLRVLCAMRQSALRLDESERRYRLLFEQSRDGIVLIDPATLHFADFNSAACAQLGYSREEFAALSLPDIMFDEDAAETTRLIAAVREHGWADFETRQRRKDGEGLDVHVVVQALELNGKPLLCATHRDIGARKKAEQALRESRNFLQTVIETIPVRLFWKDRAGRYLGCNSVFANDAGVSDPQEIVGKDDSQFVWREQAELYRDDDRLVLSTGIPKLAFEKPQTSFGGETIWLRTSKTPLRDGRGEIVGVLGVYEDISERKRNELEIQQLNAHLEQRVDERTAELREAEEALKRLNETLARQVRDKVDELRQKDHLLIQQTRLAAMGEMVHNIAHQWRQPLNALGLIFQNLSFDFHDGVLDREGMSAETAKAMKLIHGMSETIDDFRNFFRPDNQAREFDIAAAVRETLTITGAALANHEIVLDALLQPGLAAHGHANQFSQAVLNLITNAKDAILAESPRNGRISLRLHGDGDNAVLVVEDNGGGIPAELRHKIFDPYFTTKEQGSGIGLYMAKVIIEHNLDGSLELTALDGGARFTVTVPLACRQPKRQTG